MNSGEEKNSHRGFWDTLPKPFFALAPMANVTDVAFRSTINKYGKPDVFWSEFVSNEGLLSDGHIHLLPDLYFLPDEQPIVAQIFGSRPETFEPIARLCQDLGFSGVDINMGCPDKSVNKQGSGAALCRTPEIAQEIIEATKRGADKIPVTVKIRLGWDSDELETWLPTLLEKEPAAVSIHCRTRKEMSKVPARWDRIKDAVEINNAWAKNHFGDLWQQKRALIVGNGDVPSVEDGQEKAAATGADGVMIGRGIFGDPWCFNKHINRLDLEPKVRLQALLEHTELFEKVFGDNPQGNFRGPLKQATDEMHPWLTSKERIKSFSVMKKHFGSYVTGFHNAKTLKVSLMDAPDLETVREILKKEIER